MLGFMFFSSQTLSVFSKYLYFLLSFLGVTLLKGVQVFSYIKSDSSAISFSFVDSLFDAMAAVK